MSICCEKLIQFLNGPHKVDRKILLKSMNAQKSVLKQDKNNPMLSADFMELVDPYLPKIDILASNSIPLKYTLTELQNYIELKCVPSNPGTYSISVKVNDEDIYNSPLKVVVKPTVDLSKISYKFISGFYNNKVFINKPCELVVDYGNVLADLFKIESDSNCIKIEKVEGIKGKYIINPIELGSCSLDFKYDDEHVENISPINLNIFEAICLNNYIVSDIPEIIEIEKLIKIKVNGSNSTSNEEVNLKITPLFEHDFSAKIFNFEKSVHLDFTEFSITLYSVGKYKFTCSVYGDPLPTCTKKLVSAINTSNIKMICDSSKAFVNQVFSFKFDVSQSGDSNLDVYIKDKNDNLIQSKSIGRNNIGIESFTFTPVVSGIHVFIATYGKIPVNSLAQEVIASYNFDSSKIKVIIPDDIRCNKEEIIVIDTVSCGKCPVTFQILDPLGKPIETKLLADINDTLSKINFIAHIDGNYKLKVFVDNVESLERILSIKPLSDPTKVKVSGDGIKSNNSVLSYIPTNFVVDKSLAGEGHITTEIFKSDDSQLEAELLKVQSSVSSNLTNVEYLAPSIGLYTIHVFLNNIPVLDSPFTVNVSLGFDPNQCVFLPPALPNELFCYDKITFKVDCSNAGNADLSCKFFDEKSLLIDDIKCNIMLVSEIKTKKIYEVTITPTKIGSRSLEISYGGRPITKSYTSEFTILKKGDYSKVKCTGSGLLKSIINTLSEFVVDTSLAGHGNLKINPLDDSNLEFNVINENEHVSLVKYCSKVSKSLSFKITFNDVDVVGSPFNIFADLPVDASKVICKGNVLESQKNDFILSQIPAKFTVNAKESGQDDISVDITYQEKDETLEKIIKIIGSPNDKLYEVEFTPLKKGNYSINVYYGNSHVKDSPFKVFIGDSYDTSKVVFSSIKNNLTVFNEFSMDVDCSSSGNAQLSASFMDPLNTVSNCLIVPNEQNDKKLYTISFIPTICGKYKLNAKLNESSIEALTNYEITIDAYPFLKDFVITQKPNKVVRLGHEVVFTVTNNDSGAIKNPLKVTEFHSAKSRQLEANVFNGEFNIKWKPESVGVYNVEFSYGGSKFGSSLIEVLESIDMSNIIINGLTELIANGVTVLFPFPLIINTLPILEVCGPNSIDESSIEGIIESEKGLQRLPINSLSDGFYQVAVGANEIGSYKLTLLCDHTPISVCKFEVHNCGISHIKVTEFTDGFVKFPYEFVVDLRSSGYGKISLNIDGPMKPEILYTELGNGTMHIVFVALESGVYDVSLLFNGELICGFPKKIVINSMYPFDIDNKSPLLNQAFNKIITLPFKFLNNERFTAKALNSRVNDVQDVSIDLLHDSTQNLNVSFVPSNTGLTSINIMTLKSCSRKDSDNIKNQSSTSSLKWYITNPICLYVEKNNDLLIGIQAQLNLAVYNEKPFIKILDSDNTAMPFDQDPVLIHSEKDIYISRIRFTPKKQGQHQILIDNDNDHSNSVFCESESKPQFLFENKIKVNAVPITNELVVKIYQPFKASLDLTKDIADKLSINNNQAIKAYVSSPDDEKSCVLCSFHSSNPDQTNSKIIIRFVPQKLGKHKLCFFDDHLHNLNSSINFFVRKPTDVLVNSFAVKVLPIILSNEINDPINQLLFTAYLETPLFKKNFVEVVSFDEFTSEISVILKSDEEGLHLLHIFYDKVPCTCTPFIIFFDSSPQPLGFVGENCFFSVDLLSVTSDEAKLFSGYVDCPKSIDGKISTLALPIKINIDSNGFQCNFEPKICGTHYLHIFKNNVEIPESPLEVIIEAAPNNLNYNNIMLIPSNALKINEIELPPFLHKLIECNDHARISIKYPSSEKEEPVFLIETQNTFVVKFLARENGLHFLRISLFGTDLCPLISFHVFIGSPKEIAEISLPCDQKIFDAIGIVSPFSNKDVSQIAELVQLNNCAIVKWPIKSHGKYSVGFETSRDFSKELPENFNSFDKKHVVYCLPKYDPSWLENKSCIQVGVELKEFEGFNDETIFVGRIKDFNGNILPVQIKLAPNKNGILVKFLPLTPGFHELQLFINGVEAKCGNLKLIVDENTHLQEEKIIPLLKPCIPSNVFVYGRGIIEALINENNSFSINPSKAGFGNIDVSIDGPGKITVNCTENENGVFDVIYSPSSVGIHTINVIMDKQHVSGSPFTINAVSVPVPDYQPIKNITYKDNSFYIECLYDLDNLKIPLDEDLEIIVLNKSQFKLPTEVVKQSLTPEQLLVKFSSTDCSLSNYKIKIIRKSDDKVMHEHNISFPLQNNLSIKKRYKPNEKIEFTINSKSLSSNQLSLSLEGPVHVDLNTYQDSDNNTVISFVPEACGVYMIYAKIDEIFVNESPFEFHVGVNDNIVETQRVITIGNNAKINIEMAGCGFSIDSLKTAFSSVVDPFGSVLTLNRCEFLEETEQMSLEFIPTNEGYHRINILVDGKDIPGSPFIFNAVKGKQVIVQGSGIERAIVNEINRFYLYTFDVAGKLSFNLNGPGHASISCKVFDKASCVDESLKLDNYFPEYDVEWTPTNPGVYELTVMINDRPIDSNPFIVLAKTDSDSWLTEGDPTLCHLTGRGLQIAEVNTMSHFNVDTSNAGPGLLMVGIQGPNELPAEELSVKHLFQKRFSVSYKPTSTGLYKIVVYFGGKHVNGSPFSVMVS